MALTRKMLAAMDIPAEKIDEIITAHTETVEALKKERDDLKGELDATKDIQNELKTTKDELEKFKTGDWEKKYTDLESEYKKYKDDVETKAVKSAKETAYKELLLSAGIPDKRVASVLRVSDVDSIELDDEGKIKDADKLTETVKTEWADFIPTTKKKGADVSNPPENNGGEVKKPSQVAQMVAQYRNEHYGNPIKKED